MSKKLNDQEIVEVLNAMSDAAKRILKNVKKKDLAPIEQAETMLSELKSRYSEGVAAE